MGSVEHACDKGDAVNEYCKLGCASSVCGGLTTLQNSDATEIVNGQLHTAPTHVLISAPRAQLKQLKLPNKHIHEQ
ncbi:hypothetical protein Bca52824_002552 [Brassica carinata]|uniref:Uncharacterized protein n=1 Tax=Brassica carinata TaxID=52824 RepID=A0A8X8BE12_BRACI|nr:hypothetical protein Bca52824_002552 [Brassica carinata]